MLFFSSSLLIVYEGKDVSKNTYQDVSSKPKLRSWTSQSSSEESDTSYSDTEVSELELREHESDDDSRVTMKMIDFAHSTFEGFMDDSVVHIGPDAGYLKGIDTLIGILAKAVTAESTTS